MHNKVRACEYQLHFGQDQTVPLIDEESGAYSYREFTEHRDYYYEVQSGNRMNREYKEVVRPKEW